MAQSIGSGTRLVVLVVFIIFVCIVGTAEADFIFGEPVNLGPTVNGSRNEPAASISTDGLSLFFTSDRGGGFGFDDLWVATRATIDDPWGEPVNLGSMVNSSSADGYPSISADGLTLYFVAYQRPGGKGMDDLWMTTRATTDDPWENAVNLGSPVNSGTREFSLGISADGLSLYFGSTRLGGSGGYDLWVTVRATTNDDWSEPLNLGPTVNNSVS